jgi:DNA-binding MarR family transcriptional regulator
MYYSVNKLARHLNSIADEEFKKMDITATQGFALIAIGDLDKHTPSEIAAELEMKPSTITRFLDKLEELGYVKREYHGRNTEVDMTELGKEKLKEVFQCWKGIHDRNAETFGDKIAQDVTDKVIEANKLYID